MPSPNQFLAVTSAVQGRVSLYHLYEKQRRSVSNSYAVVSTLAARRQKSFCKNNKERLLPLCLKTSSSASSSCLVDGQPSYPRVSSKQ
jgi:hypothetical protein